jgi:hypothetical protein
MLAPLSLCLILTTILNTQAVNVYLSPPRTHSTSVVSPEYASAALSRHLGLEVFEPFHDAPHLGFDDTRFIGQGERNAMVVTVEETYARMILPEALQLGFTLETPSTPMSSLSSIISTCLHRASHVFTSLFPTSLVESLDDVRALVSFFDSAKGSAFAAVDLSKIHGLNGGSPQETKPIIRELRAFLNQIAQEGYSLAILTYTPSQSSFDKRSPVESQAPLPSTAPPQQPIGAISTCYTSLESCKDSTNSCSERGQCVEASKAGRTCFVCNCGVTQTGKGKDIKTEYWAGEKCERKDISGPFVLLTGTVVLIILLIFGSISLLYTVGEHPLPSTLLATAINVKKE